MINNPPSLPLLGMARLLPHAHYLTPEEQQNLQKGSDGKVHVFLNGIFTTPDEAAHNAVQLADNKNDPHYFLMFPHSDSLLVEGFIAGYQYFLEGKLGVLTNSTKKYQNLLYSLGNIGLHTDAHSRGSMTAGNGSYNLVKHGVHGIANENTTINFYGPAFNALFASGLLGYVSDSKQTTIGFDGHRYDFVSRWIGGNGYTYETAPAGSSRWKETWKMFTNPYNPHTCLGDAGNKCRTLYGSSHLEQFPLNKSRSKK
ncbi:MULTISPECIES: filamentous hemagglutinin [unclassified Bartonella]|uniref:filamentous hemagglutinin n=1 Tax=unclassified Bartonella TaxID=2645622 RepID=UPI0035CED5ED